LERQLEGAPYDREALLGILGPAGPGTCVPGLSTDAFFDRRVFRPTRF
jgi:hypothetical protein